MKVNIKTILKKKFQPQSIPLFPVVEEIPGDLETPVSAFLKLKKYRAKFLLESVEMGEKLGRYSFIGLESRVKIKITEENLILEEDGLKCTLPLEQEEPLLSLKKILQTFSIQRTEFPRLLGGLVGYLSYDYVRFLEKIPDRTPDNLNLPIGLFYLVDQLIVFDHLQRKIKIVSLTDSNSPVKIGKERKRIAEVIELLNAPLELGKSISKTSSNEICSDFSQEEFCQKVLKAQEHIRCGNIYQLVLSQRLSGNTSANPFQIYRALRMLNPSPYMFFLDFDDFKLVGSSPEVLIKLENGTAWVRPLAGTRPRGSNQDEDLYLTQELLTDEKEKAEHIMLVDLGRNDLGRCCQFGTVQVTDLMTIEKYSHVMHMVSQVEGKLNSGFDQFDLFKAAFPAGTVTGAPKIRAMQIIEELEKEKRGPYAGAVGYFSLTGNMDMCITIRTIILKKEKPFHKFFLQGGAGIVFDSVPEKEYQESLSKIEALTKAIKMAEKEI